MKIFKNKIPKKTKQQHLERKRKGSGCVLKDPFDEINMKEIKFKTPIAMKCTQEQYDRDLKQPLKELGYVECNMDVISDRCNILSTSFCNESNNLGFGYGVGDRYRIPTYNPKLFIALAGMTKGEDWIAGEWFKCINSNTCFLKHFFNLCKCIH